MITLPEVTSAVYGAFRLARLDPGGLKYFDDSIRGFWMSFWATVLILPGIMFLGQFDPGRFGPDINETRFVTVSVIYYICSCTAYPLAMYYVAERANLLPRYRLFIVAYNWASVVQVSALVALDLFAITGFFPQAMVNFAELVVVLAIIAWSAYIARTVFQTSWMLAAGFVGIEWVIGLTLQGFRLSTSVPAVG